MPDTKPATDKQLQYVQTETENGRMVLASELRPVLARMELAEAALRAIDELGGRMPARAWKAVARWCQATNNTPGAPVTGAVSSAEAEE